MKIDLNDKSRKTELMFTDETGKEISQKITMLFSNDVVGENLIFFLDEENSINVLKFDEDKGIYSNLEEDEYDIANSIFDDFIEENKENFYLNDTKIDIFKFLSYELEEE
ncbi:hypothetical protein [Mycoplasma sp. 1012]